MAALAESNRAFTSLAFRCSSCELIEPAYIAEAIQISAWTEGANEAERSRALGPLALYEERH